MNTKSTASLYLNNKKIDCLAMELPLMQKEPEIIKGSIETDGSISFQCDSQTNTLAINQLINRSLIFM